MHGSKGVVDPDWQERLAPIGLDDPRQWSKYRAGEVASASRSTNSFKVTLAGGEQVFFKRYVYTNHRLRSLFMPSKSVVEGWGLTQMAAVGCRTPELLALGETRLLGNVRAAYLVTRAIANTTSLDQLTEKIGDLPDQQPQEWNRLVNAIAADLIPQLQAMHRVGLFHYDLKWRNLLIEQQGPVCRVHLIDCPRARRRRWRPFRGQVVELSALSRLAIVHLTRYQRIKFLLRYLGKGYDARQARRLMKAVNAHLSRRPPDGWQKSDFSCAR
ncbi:MAG: lipopolysaccharide kinase InaA family protein [Gammaproteobacteria bacterium]